MENLLDTFTQLWVRSTGRRIDISEDRWLDGPIGQPNLIADQFFRILAEQKGYTIEENSQGSGLIQNIEEMGISSEDLKLLNDKIIDFYVHTTQYSFEVWSEWKGIFRPFGWLLSVLFSKRLQQLNLPLNPLDSAKGLDSKIVQLKQNESIVWTIWFRVLKATNRVIYSGVYTTCLPSGAQNRHLKVIFPLPNGNATVVMKASVLVDGSLLLASEGRRFGESGFYLNYTKKGKHWTKRVRAMHEWLHVYVDSENYLRADHNLNFYGIRFLNLHYKMNKKPN
ncbi:MAG: hypothetical protein KDC12_13555 [Flavobacteriales bacterium]|nr:hypothetical protein [Flavobacteriales bacterium]